VSCATCSPSSLSTWACPCRCLKPKALWRFLFFFCSGLRPSTAANAASLAGAHDRGGPGSNKKLEPSPNQKLGSPTRKLGPESETWEPPRIRNLTPTNQKLALTESETCLWGIKNLETCPPHSPDLDACKRQLAHFPIFCAPARFSDPHPRRPRATAPSFSRKPHFCSKPPPL